MKDGKWEDWTEPLKVLLAKANEFLEQIDFADFPRGGIRVEAPGLYLRKAELGEAFDAYVADELIGGFLDFYIYASSVFEDMYALVFEYIGENEHQVDLHGDEFAQTKEELLDDFCLYVVNWESPIAAATEVHSRGAIDNVIVADGVTKGVTDKDFKDIKDVRSGYQCNSCANRELAEIREIRRKRILKAEANAKGGSEY